MKTMPQNRWGNKVREARVQLGWTQETLAGHIGCHTDTIGSWERNEYRGVRLTLAINAMRWLGIEPEEVAQVEVWSGAMGKHITIEEAVANGNTGRY